jgi:hypothetical protein
MAHTSYSYADAAVGVAPDANCTIGADFTLDCSLEAFYDDYGLAVKSGLLCLGGQVFFTALFKALPWTRRHPTFLAHQVIFSRPPAVSPALAVCMEHFHLRTTTQPGSATAAQPPRAR